MKLANEILEDEFNAPNPERFNVLACTGTETMYARVWRKLCKLE